jgi:hypothetical protein
VPDAVPTLDDSDEEFEAQLRSMHLGEQQSLDNVDAGAGRIDGLHVDSVCAAAAVGSESDDEEETTPSAGKKKKKKKVKRNVMVAASLLEEEAAEIAASFPPCNASDEEEGDGEPVSGKKLTKKQIRRSFFLGKHFVCLLFEPIFFFLFLFCFCFCFFRHGAGPRKNKSWPRLLLRRLLFVKCVGLSFFRRPRSVHAPNICCAFRPMFVYN